ncbi:hypothetical protein HRbin24_00044 [bacterium HR24]|nr:hypothetical protein HRbin24_00044 [bacterium HR24]
MAGIGPDSAGQLDAREVTTAMEDTRSVARQREGKEVKAMRRLHALLRDVSGKAAMINAGVGFIIVLMARTIAGMLQDAIPGVSGGAEGSPASELNTLFNNLLNIGTGVALALCALFIAWGAFLYMTAEGNPARMERG